MTVDTYLLLGSNEGDRERHITTAIRKISESAGPVVKQSQLYQTAAWGKENQPDFLNQAVMIRTELPPVRLLAVLKRIERETGRVPTEKWGPRVIDIDILFYGSEILEMPELVIPHPFLAERRFTLQPLNEIAGELVHPVLHKNVAQILNDCKDKLEAKPFTTGD